MTKDEIQIRFWRDRWVGQTPFKYHFSTISSNSS
jgi:hypothetical protein